MSLIRSNHSLKMVREALYYAEATMLQTVQGQRYREIVQDLVEDIDRQRPLGRNGKHGNLHTDNCGCADRGADWDVG